MAVGDAVEVGGGIRISEGVMGVSKHRDTPKWMVYDGKPYSNW